MKVFCITTGRSGSKYLSMILGCVDNASVYHERQLYGHMPELMLHVGTGYPDVVEFIERKINVINFTREKYLESLQAYLFDYCSQNPSDLMQDTFVSNFQSPIGIVA